MVCDRDEEGTASVGVVVSRDGMRKKETLQ